MARLIAICEGCDHGYSVEQTACPWCGCSNMMSHTAPLEDRTVDTECYIDFWMCKIDGLGEWCLFPGHQLEGLSLRCELSRIRSITFNGTDYDMPMIALALAGADNRTLKAASDAIITRKLKGWQFMREYGLDALPFEHIDIMQVLPGQNSLKMYGAKNHSRRIQDLPYDPSMSIGPVERWRLREYCQNDLDTTRELYEKFHKEFALREEIGAKYGLNVMSKSDPQIAEAVMIAELGFKPKPPVYPAGMQFQYRYPDWLDPLIPFEPFSISDAGKIVFDKIPNYVIGERAYRVGIGGLHSFEKSVSWWSDDDYEISDHDVASYYPSLIIRCGVSPVQLEGQFLPKYTAWRDRRVDAKGDPARASEASSLKTFLNGTFGKLNEQFSIFYSPPDLLQVTLTGQVALLMLIRDLEQCGIRVISANTDGLVVYCHRRMTFLRDEIIAAWGHRTGLTTEMTRYRSLHSRDVNNYIAVKEDGSVKLKGDYAPPVPVGTSWPSPTAQVSVEAAIADILEGKPPAEHVYVERDVRKFLLAQKVTGGAVWRDEHLGKVARWYWSKDGDVIRYVKNGNKVALSDDARPMMELTDELPEDVMQQAYIERAHNILKEIGL